MPDNTHTNLSLREPVRSLVPGTMVRWPDLGYVGRHDIDALLVVAKSVSATATKAGPRN